MLAQARVSPPAQITREAADAEHGAPLKAADGPVTDRTPGPPATSSNEASVSPLAQHVEPRVCIHALSCHRISLRL